MDNINPLYTIKEGAVLQRALSNSFGTSAANRAGNLLTKTAANAGNRSAMAGEILRARKDAYLFANRHMNGAFQKVGRNAAQARNSGVVRQSLSGYTPWFNNVQQAVGV